MNRFFSNHCVLLFTLSCFPAPFSKNLPGAEITIEPGADLRATVEGASDADVIRLKAGRYESPREINSRRNLTIIGIPYEQTRDEAAIRDVVVVFKDSVADNWNASGKLTLRGIMFQGGAHQFQLDHKFLVEHCIFEDGQDQVRFDKRGYGEVRHCEFLGSSDDGIDIDTQTVRL